jgi:cytoskeletal protein RodZ
MAVGADLRHARLARNRSIEDISRATKISPSVLGAIEQENFDKVASGLFRRGYLRAYAREVGLDPDEVVQQYRDEFEPAPPEPTPEQAAARASRVRHTDDDVLTRSRPFIELGVIALIAAACFSFVVRSSKPASAPALETHAPAQPPAPAPTRSSPDRSVATSGSSETTPHEVTIQLRATGPCWIEATSAGKRVVARLMNEGDTETVTVRHEVWLRIGEPSTLSYTIDGVAGRPLGPPGKPVRVQISPQNYREFVPTR